ALDRPERELGRQEQARSYDRRPPVDDGIVSPREDVPGADQQHSPRDRERKPQNDAGEERERSRPRDSASRRGDRVTSREGVCGQGRERDDGETAGDQARATRAWRRNALTSSIA